jgi:hypothetical protein
MLPINYHVSDKNDTGVSYLSLYILKSNTMNLFSASVIVQGQKVLSFKQQAANIFSLMN